MSETLGNDPVGERELVITREFDAPARLVFEAYRRPELLMRWFGPHPYPLALCEVDFRVGGRYRFAMRDLDGTQMTPFGGEYVDIVPNRRIAFTNAFETPGSETMVMTVTLDEHAGRTRLTLHTLFASAAHKASYLGQGFEEGTAIGYDQLAAVLAETSP